MQNQINGPAFNSLGGNSPPEGGEAVTASTSVKNFLVKGKKYVITI